MLLQLFTWQCARRWVLREIKDVHKWMDPMHSYIIVICFNCKYWPALIIKYIYVAQFNTHHIIYFEFTILMQFQS